MLVLIPVFSVLALVIAQETALPNVTITQGRVIGSVAQDGEYFQFYGIPYADSTSGSHRFKAPRPAPSFQQDFIANRKGVKCVHALGVGFDGTEDCLVANIFTPTLNTAAQLPVMVWIKGREFDKDHEIDISFKNFVEKDVIVVSLNYRESILGFLCLGTQAAPGNAGLKDVIAGLRWVKDNIAQFGGNPNDITLFGHGSGAAVVDLVTMSPLAANLTHKAIAQSGNAMAPWAVSRNNLAPALQVAEALGHEITTIDQLSEVFTRTSVAALMAVINELDLTDNSLPFAPCIEKSDLAGVEPFLIKTPAQIIAANEFLQIPFITGYVDNEGTIRAEEALEDEWLERMDESFEEFLPADLKLDTEATQTILARSIRNFYFQNNTIDLTTAAKYLRYHGETMMLVSALREVRARALVSTQPTYLYQFSYKGTLGGNLEGPLRVESAAHSGELAYMFYGSPVVGTPMRDLAVGDILIERWTNFAKTGIPSSETSQVLWQPFTQFRNSYIRVLNNHEVINNSTLELSLVSPHVEAVEFWHPIYQTYFLDAESNWVIHNRTEDDNTTTTTTTTPAPGGDNTGSTQAPGGGDAGTTQAPGGDGTVSTPAPDGNGTVTTPPPEGGDSPDSASTAVGYTFLIVCLFSILGQFHNSQILS